MKDNIFLRAAAYLLVVVIVSLSLLSGTLAKYVASTGTDAGARVARFSFVAKQSNTAPSSGWQEVAVAAGTPAPFSVPLFDTAYYTPVLSAAGGGAYFNGPASRSVTVNSSDLVVAPGTGINFGEGVDNTKYLPNPDNGDNTRFTRLYFKNNSEVSVRYRLSLDTDATELLGLKLYFIGWNAGGSVGNAAWLAADSGAALTDGTSGWRNLPPNSSAEFIDVGWFWVYDEDGYGYDPGSLASPNNSGYYGSLIRGFVADKYNPDIDDTYLGWLAAEYLREAAAGTAGAEELDEMLALVTMRIGLRLDVEQIN